VLLAQIVQLRFQLGWLRLGPAAFRYFSEADALLGAALTPASAQSKLGTLVKGQLIGVRVTKHGVSPRIIRANVVGTRGSTTVTGAQLQGAFGLMSTYAAFTTITTLAGQSPTPAHPGPFTLGVYRLAAALAPGVHGSVFPAKKGGPVTIEVKGPTGWRSTAHVRLGAHGSYSAAVAGAGTYRVVYRGSAGPAVSVP